MRILLLNQTFYPEHFATSQQVTDLACFLKEKGHEVTVYTGRRGYENRKKVFKKSEVWQGIHIERIHSTGLGKASVFRRILDSLTFDLLLILKLLFTPQFDVVVSFTSPPLLGVFGTLFCLLKGGRSVQWLMDINPDAAFEVGYINSKSLAGRVLNAIFEWTLKKSSNVVVLDRWMKERIINHGVSGDKITIIPPWSVLDKTEVNIPMGIFRKENDLEGKFVILYSGNHSVVHPLDTLLEAARILKDHKDIVFVFSGSGLRTKDVEVFKVVHHLENIKQLPWQTREALMDSFRSVNLHAVVMGENMTGLVHLSKIYSVFNSARPFLFIGPEKSHVVDLLKSCDGGAHVNHKDAEALVRKILEFRNLEDKLLCEMGKRNETYIQAHFDPYQSKLKFEQEIVQCPSRTKLRFQEGISTSRSSSPFGTH